MHIYNVIMGLPPPRGAGAPMRLETQSSHACKAPGPRLPNANKPRNPLAGRGACEPRPVDPNAPGPDRALLHLTMKHTTQLPTTLAGEEYFIVEGLTDNVITLAANTLTSTTDAWDVAVGHPRRVRTGYRAQRTR